MQQDNLDWETISGISPRGSSHASYFSSCKNFSFLLVFAFPGGSSLWIIIFIILLAVTAYFLKNEGLLPFLG